jgi:hypothetical protein
MNGVFIDVKEVLRQKESFEICISEACKHYEIHRTAPDPKYCISGLLMQEHAMFGGGEYCTYLQQLGALRNLEENPPVPSGIAGNTELTEYWMSGFKRYRAQLYWDPD